MGTMLMSQSLCMSMSQSLCMSMVTTKLMSWSLSWYHRIYRYYALTGILL